MASLLIGNVDDSASDDDLRDLLARHGFPPWDSIEHMPGDGIRPAVLRETAPGVPVQQVLDATGAALEVSDEVMYMDIEGATS